MKFLLTAWLFAAGASAATLAQLAAAFAQLDLDPTECYRVRDLALLREDLRLFFNDGYLIFARPIGERIPAAVFSAEGEGGDAEILLLPPTRAERFSLARFTGAPNLNEHLSAGVLLFSDLSGSQLLAEVKRRQLTPRPEVGDLLKDHWTSVVRNLAQSFEVRLLQDYSSPLAASRGFVYGAVSGKKLGNFDFIFDPRAREQITVGQLVFRDNRSFFDVWTNFPSRSRRTGQAPLPPSRLSLSNFRIVARLDTNLALSVTTRARVHVSDASDRALAFDLSRRMQVINARFDGKPADFYSRPSLRADLLRGPENGLILIAPAEPPQPGQQYEMEIQAQGQVITPAGNDVYYVGSRGAWYPGAGAGFSPYDVTFIYPKTFDLVGTGEVVEDRTEGDFRITRRVTQAPVRFAGFNLGRYQKFSLQRAGYTVEVYANRTLEPALQPRREIIFPPPPAIWNRGPGIRRPPDLTPLPAPLPPPDPSARLRELSENIAGALEFMSARFGPLPLKTLTVSPIPGNFGQGFPGLIYLSTLAYVAPSDPRRPSLKSNSEPFFTDLLHAHEVAHQWWGNIVMPATAQDDWLMEALATYSSLMDLERRRGRRTMDEVLDRYRNHLLEPDAQDLPVESAGPITLGLRLASSQSPAAWQVITYEKGAWIIHMLRGRMGEANFTRFLGEFRRKFEFQTASTENFRTLAAQFVPAGMPDKTLESFFEQWVYSTGIPSLKLSHTVAGKPPAVRVKLTLTQTGAREDFTTLVPVEVLLPGKRTVTQWLVSSSEPATWELTLKQTPLKISLDPHNFVLKTR